MADDFYLQYAAHVGHAVTHQSSSGKLALAAGGIVIGAVIVILAAPEAITMAVVLEGASTVGLYGSVGKITGGIVDSFIAPGKAGELISGLNTVLLGPAVKPAARVFEDTHASCDGAIPAEGSKTVMLGPEFKPMSRRGDRLECNGVISEGIDSIIIGGVPSKKGIEIDEKDPAALKWLGVGLDILSLPKELGWKLAVGVAQVALEATDHDKASKLAGVPLDKPTNTAGWIKAFSDANDAAGVVVPKPAGKGE